MANGSARLERAAAAARHAKQVALKVAREADRLLKVARQRVKDEAARRQLKQKLERVVRVLRAAGKAAVVAAVRAGRAASRGEARKGTRRPRRKRAR